MTEKSLVTTSRTATDLLASGDEAEHKLRAMTRKIMRLITPGGRNLTTDEAAQMAVYCWMTDLNPANFEAYWMDGVGPYPGVSGYRRKANEYLAITSAPDDRFYVHFRDALPGEGNFDPDKDIARHATLRIRSASEHWQQNIMSIWTKFVTAGVDTEVAWERAELLGGPEPVWTAVGVVDHREKFSRAPGTKGKDDPGTPDKWDKVQRAEKRAEKGAIRKAFPTVLMPDVDLGEQASIDATIVDAIVRDVTAELAEPAAPRPEAEILQELGYEAAPEPQPEPEPEPEPEPAEPEPEKPQAAEQPAEPARSWEPEYVKALLEEQVAQHPKQAVHILNMLQPKSVEEALLLGKNYRGHRDKGAEKDEARQLTLDGVAP